MQVATGLGDNHRLLPKTEVALFDFVVGCGHFRDQDEGLVLQDEGLVLQATPQEEQ
jgi:hypothetical protein